MVINEFLSTLFGREVKLGYFTASCDPTRAKAVTKLGNNYCCAGVILIAHEHGMMPTGNITGTRWIVAHCFQSNVATILDEDTNDFTPDQWSVVRKVIQSIEKELEKVDEYFKQKELVAVQLAKNDIKNDTLTK